MDCSPVIHMSEAAGGRRSRDLVTTWGNTESSDALSLTTQLGHDTRIKGKEF